jgi:hypothetical protein
VLQVGVREHDLVDAVCVDEVRQLVLRPDSAAAQEGVDAFEPRAPFEVVAVVASAVEGDEAPARLLVQTQQELVEDLTPSRSVGLDGGGGR